MIIPNLQSIGIGAVAGLALGGMIAWPLAYDRGDSAGEKRIRAASEQVINKLITERDQARGEVDKINAANTAQIGALVANYQADSLSRAEAQKAMEAFTRNTARETQASRQSIDAVRAGLQNLSDQCAKAGVDPALVGMLNSILAAPFKGNSAVSGASGDTGSVIPQPAAVLRPIPSSSEHH